MGTFVLFIGGYQASKTDVNLWTASAKQQKGDWDFEGYPWPPSARHADAKSGSSAFEHAGSLKETVKKIEDGRYDKVFIIGHSSGCAIANAIDQALKEKKNVDMDRVNLVALDGFSPSQAQLGRGTTQVWSAQNGTAKSLNYNGLQGALKGRLKVYTANKDCTNIWSLHFSLVNSNSSDRTVKTNKDLANGYLNCRANMCWVPATP